ncbi:hypothetical protein TRVA0_001S00848 [Trichomonascus vanleenenianus]|uniref:4a-hydroxytetrahydrobiopterin dehydratase n=1 Tax=Trichomonascus vanleenenianus TaxID=2268995 RepID=UPI003ECA519B
MEPSKALAELPLWKAEGSTSIAREWKFKGFTNAWAFCTQVAMLAHHKNHHPKIENEFNRVKLTLTTHDTGGLTDLDVDLAKSIDKFAKKYPERE